MARHFSVLLVEDDDPLRRVLREALDHCGFRVHAAARGDEALEVVRHHEIDFSILDLHLPGMSGVEVFRRIREEIRPLPAILMSGEATTDEARAALELGMFEFIRKPIELAALRRSLDQLIRAHFESPTLPIRLQDLYRLTFLPDPNRRPDNPS